MQTIGSLKNVESPEAVLTAAFQRIFISSEKAPRVRKTWIGSKMELHWQYDSSHLLPPLSVSSVNHYY